MKSESKKGSVGNSIPQHVAIIMDGNGRWARRRVLPRLGGHRRGAETVRSVVTICRELGVKVLTLYAFSEENWARPEVEISALMKILKRFLVSERKLLQEKDVRLLTLGNVDRLPSSVRKTLEQTMALTRGNRSMSLVLALSYGGRDEIVRATRQIAEKVKAGKITPDEIDAELFASHLDTDGLPDPDLLIRTSGEFRTSNFLPWQAIYSELYFTPTLWPDFTPDEFRRAVAEFSRRERRFGRTGDQLPEGLRWNSGN